MTKQMLTTILQHLTPAHLAVVQLAGREIQRCDAGLEEVRQCDLVKPATQILYGIVFCPLCAVCQPNSE